jgi:hypothetical protein
MNQPIKCLDQDASSSASAPYELLIEIFRLLITFQIVTNADGNSKKPDRPISLAPLVSVSLVCRQWFEAASDVLYRAIEPSSHVSARLLMRTLLHDQKGYKERIKVLRLPLITPSPSHAFGASLDVSDFSDMDPEWKLCKLDGHGTPYLITRDSLELLPMHLDELLKDFTQLISLCPSLEELHAPGLGEVALREPGAFIIPNLGASLRNIVLSGYGVMDVFARDILVGGQGHKGFWHLESVAIFDFNTRSSLEAHPSIWSRLSGSLVEDRKSAVPNLKRLHLQRGVLDPAVLAKLLGSTGGNLQSLHISNIDLTKSDKQVLEDNQHWLKRLTHLALDYHMLALHGIDIAFLDPSKLFLTIVLYVSSKSRIDQALLQPEGRGRILQIARALPSELAHLDFIIYLTKRGPSATTSTSAASEARRTIIENAEATLDAVRICAAEVGVQTKARLRHTDQEVSLRPALSMRTPEQVLHQVNFVSI